VIVYNPDGSVRFDFMAFGAGFMGGVHVATGDISHDGYDDIIVGAGAGSDPHVEVYDGATGQLIRSFLAFAPEFRGGVTVAATDVNGDGVADIIVGAASGMAPHVEVFDGVTNALRMSFFAFDQGFVGGVTVAGGDVNGDGYGDIIVGAAAGAGPEVRVFSGRDQSLLYSFFAFDPGFQGGVTVAAGDVNGDGKADIIVGAGPGADPHVVVFDGATGNLIQSFQAYDSGFRGGVAVGYTTEADGTGAIVTGAGSGGRAHVRFFHAAADSPGQSFLASDSIGASGISVG
jgi:hypothetical protein